MLQVIFESVRGAFASADLAVAETPAEVEGAVVETTAAVELAVLEAAAAVDTWEAVIPATGVLVTGAATTAVDFVEDGCPPGAEAQPQTALANRRTIVGREVRVSGMLESAARSVTGGTSPNQAASCRPFLKVRTSPMLARRALAPRGPMPGI